MPIYRGNSSEADTVLDTTPDQMGRLALAEYERRELAKLKMGLYYNDPVAWAHDCINWDEGVSLAPYQEEVLAALPDKHRVAQRGPRGLGKSTTSAIAVLWFALTRDAAGVDWKCVTTAGGWAQLEHFLWPEIHKWAKKLNWQAIGRDPFGRNELITLNLNLTFGSAFAMASSDPARMEGAHADSVFYIFDESKIISAETFDAAEGAFSGNTEALLLASSTPGDPAGRFYDIHSRKPGFEDWWVKHVSLLDAIRAGRISTKWAKQRKRQWGQDSQLYANYVLGEFHSSDEDSVIPLQWVEMAIQRWYENADQPLAPLDRVGIDVAGTGSDETVFAHKHGLRVSHLQHIQHEDTEQLYGRLSQINAENPNGPMFVIDADGMGVGLYDRCNHDRRMTTRKFQAGVKSDKKDRSGALTFKNHRSAAWWGMRELLDPMEGSTIELPDDDMLVGDLTAPKWSEPQSKGVIQVESKDDIKKRLKRSTDSGDSVVMAYDEPKVRKKRRMTFAGPADRAA